MSNSFSFSLLKTKNLARAGYFDTPHGRVETPVFMPVGTLGTVKALDTQDILATQAQIILGNTYHLYLRPGMEKLTKLGGLHKFMGWDKPILTDSGGFQVFSLGERVKILEDGVEFRSHINGDSHKFTPTKAIQIQRQIGADIIMAFDQCVPDKADAKLTQSACDKTHRWAVECIEKWEKHDRLSEYGNYQALFGIIQGGMHKEFRQESAKFITSQNFDGIAVGGETVGYNMKGTEEVFAWIESMLPADKPRYAMGLGRDPQDVVTAIQLGVDMFDCVGPTRIARNGALYDGQLKEVKSGGETKLEFVSKHSKGRIRIEQSEYATDTKVISQNCKCHTCASGYTRAYLHHLSKTKELAYYRLASIHNVRFMIDLVTQVRDWILS